MKYCKNCGKEMNDQSRFCPACGTCSAQTTEHSQATYCEYCGKELHEGAAFCPYCGKQCAHAPETEYGTPETAVSRQKESSGRYSILEYLRTAVSLEKSLYMQEQAIERLQNHIESLGIKGNFAEPAKQDYSGVTLLLSFLLGLAGAFVGVIIGVITGNPVGWLVFTGLAVFFFAVVHFKMREAEVEREHEKNMESYSAKVKADEKRVAEELEKKRQLQKLLDGMIDKKKETESILDRYYAEGVLHEKYHRDMKAVCYFYDYFDTGVCSSLYGYEGAYKTYERDKQVGIVIENLEEIRAGQYALYCAIEEGKQAAQQLVLETAKQTQFTAQIAENTAVAAYYSEIAASNARACALIGLANHIGIWEVHRRIGE